MDYEQVLNDYMAEMAKHQFRELDPVASTAVCLTHDGEFTVARVGSAGKLMIEGKEYSQGDKVIIPAERRAAYAVYFTERQIIPTYIIEHRKKHAAMKDYLNQVITPAVERLKAAEDELHRGEALEIAALGQLDNAKRIQDDGRAHKEDALKALAEVLTNRPE